MNNKKLANRILALTILLFFLSAILKHSFGNYLLIKLLYAVSEAAVVGGIADWFAITALFERPLGITWHTCLIPNHRRKLIKGMAKLVQEELLSKSCIQQKIGNINLIQLLITWVNHQDGKSIVFDFLQRCITQFLQNMDSQRVALMLEQLLKDQVSKLKLTPKITNLLQWVVEHHKDEGIILFVLDELIFIANQPNTKKQIYQYLQRENEQTDHFIKNTIVNLLVDFRIIDYEEAATVLQEELLATLVNLKNNEYPLRIWLNDRLKTILLKLATDEQWEQDIEVWKNEAIHFIDAKPFFIQQLELIKEKQEVLTSWICIQLEQYWDLFVINEALQNKVEEYLQKVVHQMIEQEHAFIGVLVGKALNILSDKDLNKFVEDMAGQDLQWIRMNGAIVGSLVGLLLFLFLNFVHYPFLVPILRNL